MARAKCENCGAELDAAATERTPCLACGSAGPARQEFSASLGFGGSLGAIVHRKPVRRRRLTGYVITVVLAIVGFGIGLAVHSLVAAAVAATVILLLGIVANEVWASEVHHHHEHFPNL